MGVADRARKQIPAQGDYLEKDDLIRAQDEPFGIANVTYDEKGTNFGPRWVLTLVPWFDDQEGPKGLLTFTANPTRNPFMEDLQLQIEENDNEPIGPCVLIKDKSQKGYRYYTIDDWSEAAPSAPAPAPAARPQRPSAPAPQQEAAAAPPAVEPEPVKRRPGRPRKTTTSAPTTTSATSSSTSGPPVPATREPVAEAGEAAHAREVGVPRTATVTCPECGQEVTGRVLPNDKGQFFIIHTYCPKLNKAITIEYIEAK
jgi:hypothetical protein